MIAIAKVILDSTYNGNRLTTLELEYPRYIHSELMTHRVFSRNASSTRAIPVDKYINNLSTNPVYPIFMANQPGMQADIELKHEVLDEAYWIWSEARESAIRHARGLLRLGVHKQIANRILEPFSTIKVIVSATEWDNFFRLRISPDAQQEIQLLAISIKKAMDDSTPIKLDIGHWHLPYIRSWEEGMELSKLKKISAARCARVSYLNQDKLVEYDKDEELHDRLIESRHASPFEHQATPNPDDNITGNFVHWNQYRYYIGI